MNHVFLVSLLLTLPFPIAAAQETSKTLVSTLEVYVFPSQGQAADQQFKNEAECYQWY